MHPSGASVIETAEERESESERASERARERERESARERARARARASEREREGEGERERARSYRSERDNDASNLHVARSNTVTKSYGVASIKLPREPEISDDYDRVESEMHQSSSRILLRMCACVYIFFF